MSGFQIDDLSMPDTLFFTRSINIFL